ncbi:MAG: hypothetical protein OXM57_03275 [bacterium]|nr:hypothetical protein [bacterium]MDE0351693.1 hypothetical protein [bacterium]
MLNLADEIQNVRLKYETLAKRLNDLATELTKTSHFRSPDDYSKATTELRAQLIAIQEEIEATVDYINRSADLAD